MRQVLALPPMKFCILVGSSRDDGQSARVCQLISAHLSRSAACDFVYLREHRIDLCDADNRCIVGPCGLDDSVQDIVRRMVEADAVIYMPVIHAYGTNSRFQAFMERAGYGFLRPLDRPLKNKLAGIVVVGRRYAHTSVYSQIVLNVLLNKMILVGSGFPATFFNSGTSDHDEEAAQALTDMLDRMLEVGAWLQASTQSTSAGARHGQELSCR